jgi:hypothetical protein
MPSAGFVPAIPTGEQLQTNPLEYMPAGIGSVRVTNNFFLRHPLLLSVA